MRRFLNVTIGVVLAVALGFLNVELGARDEECGQWCGCGDTEAFGEGHGECQEGTCKWVECTIQRAGCDEAFNTNCESPDWCENTGPEGGEMCS